METKTLEDARQACRELVEEFGPDHVYTPPEGKLCEYVHEKDGKLEPACAVGHVLAKWGVPLAAMSNVDPRGLMSMLQEQGLLSSARGARDYLALFQTIQDDRVPWGGCLERANREFAEFL